MDGEVRRQRILELLRTSREPLSGTRLGELLGVSRQVIVQDVALLRVSGEPILSTARGYIIAPPKEGTHRAVFAVCHDREQTADELNLLVDFGLTVVDVIVEHPLYGELQGNLMLSCREDVQTFLFHLEERGARLLSELTDGYHFHTVEAHDPERLDRARQALQERGYWVETRTKGPQNPQEDL
jgi:transcriptional regulator of NAD metabolism